MTHYCHSKTKVVRNHRLDFNKRYAASWSWNHADTLFYIGSKFLWPILIFAIFTLIFEGFYKDFFGPSITTKMKSFKSIVMSLFIKEFQRQLSHAYYSCL